MYVRSVIPKGAGVGTLRASLATLARSRTRSRRSPSQPPFSWLLLPLLPPFFFGAPSPSIVLRGPLWLLPFIHSTCVPPACWFVRLSKTAVVVILGRLNGRLLVFFFFFLLFAFVLSTPTEYTLEWTFYSDFQSSFCFIDARLLLMKVRVFMNIVNGYFLRNDKLSKFSRVCNSERLHPSYIHSGGEWPLIGTDWLMNEWSGAKPINQWCVGECASE